MNNWSHESENMVFGFALMSILATIIATAMWPPLCILGFLSITALLAVGGVYD